MAGKCIVDSPPTPNFLQTLKMPKAKAQKLRAAAKNPLWSRGNLIEALAWLDFCIEHRFDFEKTVVAHLETTISKTYTEKQVIAKLRSEWKLWGPEESTTPEELLAEGSKLLVGYSDEDRGNIRAAFCRIEALTDRSVSPQVDRRSRTLSKTRRNSDSSALSLSPHTSQEFEDVSLDVSMAQENAARPERLFATAALGGSSKPFARASERVVPIIARIHTEASMHVEASQTTDDHQHSGKRLYSTTPLPTDAENQVAVLEGDVKRLRKYIFTLENQLSSARQECDEIKHSARAAAAHADEVGMQQLLRYENSLIQERLAKIDSQKRHLVMAQNDELRPSNKDIQEQWDMLCNSIHEACFAVDITSPVSFSNSQSSQDTTILESWAQRLAHRGVRELANPGSKVSEFELFRALASVGICRVAFESLFPNLLITESPLLDQYREFFLTRDGPEALSKADILAHKSLMEKSHFDTYLLEESRRASSEVCDALRPMVPLDNAAHNDSFQDVGKSSMAEKFEQGVKLALQLKAKLLLSHGKYKLVFYKPGDKFWPDTMMKDGDLPDQILPRNPSGQKSFKKGQTSQKPIPIRLCLLPALYYDSSAGQAKDHSAGIDIMQCVVNYRNFVCDKEEEDAKGLVLVAKAVVLL